MTFLINGGQILYPNRPQRLGKPVLIPARAGAQDLFPLDQEAIGKLFGEAIEDEVLFGSIEVDSADEIFVCEVEDEDAIIGSIEEDEADAIMATIEDEDTGVILGDIEDC